MRSRIVFLGMTLALALAQGCSCSCSTKDDDGTKPGSGAAALPELKIRDDSDQLLLTWIDERGEAHTELHPGDVPAAGRSLVRVVVADRQEGTGDLFYVVDLTLKLGDGAYVARTMPRREWEREIDRRRQAWLAKNAPATPPGSGVAPRGSGDPGKQQPPNDVVVIIYGADWCRPCHEAAKYLERIGVRYVMKDIEKEAGAQREMADKLEKIGRRGGTIPVIDVRGEILVGFSKSDIDRALKRARSGTVL